MEIKEIMEKKIWEDFLLGCEDKTFLQSWNWGEFQKKMGNKIWRWGIFDEENLVATVLVSKIQAKRGRFLLIQHGPNLKSTTARFQRAGLPSPKSWAVAKVKSQKSKVLEILLKNLKELAREEKVDFIRIVPLWKRNEENQEIFQNLGFREAPMHASAYEATLKLDITLPEDELLMNMRKTTRYLIRQAMKNQDIKIEKSKNLNDIEIYQRLNLKVAKRQNFVPFSFEYLKNEFEVFSKDNQILLFFGKYKNEVAAGALILFWSGIGFYHQAASDSKYAKFSIPYLILWQAILEAKKRDCHLFDFWGYVDPQKNPKHPWAGPTLFKMGFGGQVFEYLKTMDFPVSRKYWLIYLFEKLRKFKRGL